MSRPVSLQNGEEQPACMGSDSMRRSTPCWEKNDRKKEKKEESAIQVPFPFHRFYDLGGIAWMTYNVRYCNVAPCPWRWCQKLDDSTSRVFTKVCKHYNKWTQVYETFVGKSRLGSLHLAGGFFPLTYTLW